MGTALKRKARQVEKRNISIATGRLVYENILKLVDSITSVYSQISVNVYAIENDFFGPMVTVSGLLTGRDIINQLKDKPLGDELLITRSMLKAGETVFLDDCTVQQLEQELKVKVRIVENNGKDFVNAITGK